MCQTDAKLCRQTFVADEKSRDSFLNKGTIAKYENVSLMQCRAKCESISRCESFSMSEKQKECHISDTKREKVKMDFYIVKEGFVCYERA